MASEICVERQFRFHCSCGATTVTGEKTATCAACGISLRVRRVRRHQQHRGSVAYYGRGRTLPVRRVEKHGQRPTSGAIPGSTTSSRLGAWLQSALARCSEIFTVGRVESHVEPTSTAPQLKSEGILRDIPEAPRGLPAINQSPRRPWFEGAHVKVGPTRPDGTPHPHRGRTGRIARFTDAYSEPYWRGRPSAMVKLDAGIRPQGFIWVSLACLEALPGDTRSAD
jgi:hypothetical protein